MTRGRQMSRRLLAGPVMIACALSVLGLCAAPAFAAFPEEPITREVKSITGTSALFNGELNPRTSTEAVKYHFAYSAQTEPYTECISSGLTAPAEPSLFAEAEGNRKKVAQAVSGLEPNTTYLVCVIAANPAEEAESTRGTSLTFRTPAAPPAVDSETAASYTPYEERLEATVNANNETTSCEFEYGETVSYGLKAPCEQATLEGGEQGVGVTVTRLFPGTVYHYRVVLENTGQERGYGADEQFTTAALQAPVIESESSSSTTPFATTLEAQVNPGYENTACEFEYGTSSVSEHRATCSPPNLEGGAQGVSLQLTGLTPGTTYHFRVLTRNATGETAGEEMEATTLALEAPAIEGESASPTPFEASLGATVYPEYQQATCEFEYSAEEAKLISSEGTKVPCPEALGDGGGGVATSVALTSLVAHTPYFYRVIATNGSGSTPGAIEQFETETPKAPVIESESTSNITLTGATLEAQINPSYQLTQYTFEYATEEAALLEGHGTTVPGGTLPAGSIASGFADRLASAGVHGLQPDQTYYYRVVAKNATGPVMEMLTVSHFSTASTPTAATGSAQSVTATTAAVAATVNPDGLATSYYVEYGGAGYGKRTLAQTAPAGTSPLPETITLGNLEPGTTYHYRVVATNSNAGTTQIGYGEDATLTTVATPPALSGVTATAVTESAATISGTLQTLGLSTRYELYVGSTPGLLQPVSNGETASALLLTLEVGSLSPGTVYYYSLIASNLDGTTQSNGTFATASAASTGPPTTGLPALIPYTPITQLDAKEAAENGSTGVKHLTNAQKLSKALKACKKDKPRAKRVTCEKHARKRFPVRHKAGK